MKAVVYAALGFSIPIFWLVVIKTLNDAGVELSGHEAEVFQIFSQFIGIAAIVSILLVSVQIAGPHRLHRALKREMVEFWGLLRQVMNR